MEEEGLLFDFPFRNKMNMVSFYGRAFMNSSIFYIIVKKIG